MPPRSVCSHTHIPEKPGIGQGWTREKDTVRRKERRGRRRKGDGERDVQREKEMRIYIEQQSWRHGVSPPGCERLDFPSEVEAQPRRPGGSGQLGNHGHSEY